MWGYPEKISNPIQRIVYAQVDGSDASGLLYIDSPIVVQSFAFESSKGFTGNIIYGIESKTSVALKTGLVDLPILFSQPAFQYYHNDMGGAVNIPLNCKHYWYITGAATGTVKLEVMTRGG
jgi:hypothetical protein